MIGRMWRKLTRRSNRQAHATAGESATEVLENLPSDRIVKSLEKNTSHLKTVMENCTDVIYRAFHIGTPPGRKALLIYLDGMSENTLVNESILDPLMKDTRLTEPNHDLSPEETFDLIIHSVLTVCHLDATESMSHAILNVFSGNTILFVQGVEKALIVDTKAWNQRAVTEPKTEAVVRGPSEGFIEDIATNITMVRRRIKGPEFKIETLNLGRRTRTGIAIGYIEGVVDPAIVAEVKRRLFRIDTDAILESGYIEGLIEDAPLSPFNTIANTERPDVVASKLLEGRVAIFTDGTPFVLTAPALFFEAFNVSEDSYVSPIYASFIRLLRHISFFITLFLPSIYVALQTFHQELLPTSLAIAMAADREAVPFPAQVEAFIMLITFDILREAGVRMPRPIGQAVAIVGTLVLGTAAIDSRLISPAMVMVISVTGITSFVLPTQITQIAVIKYLVLILTSTVGLLGLLLSYVGLIIHLTSLRSFGVPYLTPLGPVSWDGMQDVFVRAALWVFKQRPDVLYPQDSRRQADDLKPDVSRRGPKRS